MSIETVNVRKTFGSFVALDGVSLKVDSGELVALLGMSGSGKTTLLRVIAGLEVPDCGTVLFKGEDLSTRSASQRGVGFVFQHYALFRHLSVLENVAFGLRVRPRSTRPEETEIRRRVHELLTMVQLESMASRYPSELSGGQRQRVALARALAVEPRVMLLDEPFGALDAKVRAELRRWLRRLHDETHLTSIFVTHDQEEALELADRVVVMNAGRIEQSGTPAEVYHNPANAFVCDFLGNVNLFHGRFENGGVRLNGSGVELQGRNGLHPEGRSAAVYVRPHMLEISLESLGSNDLAATVLRINAAAPVVKVELLSQSGDFLLAEIGHERYHALALQVGMHVFVRPREEKAFIYQI
ncbi:MAG TPA: sulfate ABC transporter ATP-binding protein [Candidatus Binataceae bacterium]